MSFRTSEFLQRNELVRFQLDDVIRALENNQPQEKNGYKLTINDRLVQCLFRGPVPGTKIG